MSQPDSPSTSRGIAVVGALAALLTIGTGFVYGRYTQRWGPPPDLQAAAGRLAEFPGQLGDWKLLEDKPMSEAVLEVLQCAGHVNRTYANQKTGDTIHVALIVGPPGPTSVHTPEICYSSRDYRIVARPERAIIRGSADDGFWRMTLEPNEQGEGQLRVYYAWSDGRRWIASPSPRFEFGGSRVLYKIQLAGTAGSSGAASADPCRDFLEAMLQSPWSLPES